MERNSRTPRREKREKKKHEMKESWVPRWLRGANSYSTSLLMRNDNWGQKRVPEGSILSYPESPSSGILLSSSHLSHSHSSCLPVYIFTLETINVTEFLLVPSTLDFLSYESKSVSHSVRSNSLRPHGLQLTRLLCPWHFPVKNTGVGSHSLLQGIFLTQGSNPGPLHWKYILYHLRHKGIPRKLNSLTYINIFYLYIYSVSYF